jgi:hypothetical protein
VELFPVAGGGPGARAGGPGAAADADGHRGVPGGPVVVLEGP